ncbi:MAG: rod shape-determining protein MreD [Actinobacteria bacterium]|nr:MAG: rod shape-determining protein MreD [Actinomycetota bacterium]
MNRILTIAQQPLTRLFLVALIVLSFQTTIFNSMRPFGVCLQVMLLLSTSSGLARGSEIGAIAGFIVGMMYDLVLSTPLGLGAVVFALVGYVAGMTNSFVHQPTWWTKMLLAGAASGLGMLFMPLALTIVGREGVMNRHILVVALVVGVTNAAATVPAERLCRWVLAEPGQVR